MESKQSSTLAKIRQICCAGLPSRSFMPMVSAQLREAIPAACCQFTWSSDSGRITNFWPDTFMPRRAAWIIMNHKRYEADAGINFRDLMMFGRPTGNLRFWWEQGFEATPTFAAVFRPYGFKWFLEGVVRDAMRPYGCIAMIRRREHPDFSEVDGINLDAEVAHGDFGEMQSALRDIALPLRRRIDEAAPGCELPAVVRRNGWGELVFRGYQLSGSREPSDRIGILIEQLVPFEAHLLERINATELTTRQKEIALLSVKGLPNAEVARQLNITPPP